MHIVVIGVGGVGGYFGGRLIEAGSKVSLVCRGKHLQAIKEHGLQVKSLKGDFIAHPYQVTDDIEMLEPADVILICTKSWQVTEAARSCQPILKENTVLIPLQNGADNADKIAKTIGPERALGGFCKLYSKIEAPGVINHFGHDPELLFGELDGARTERVKKVEKAFAKAKFITTVPDDIQVGIWTKFMFIATVSGLGGLTRVPIINMYRTPETRKVLEALATELHAIAKAKHIDLPETAVQDCMRFISKQPAGATASTQRDIMEGRPSELENFNGYIVEQGKKYDIPTPTHEFVYACLLPREREVRNND